MTYLGISIVILKCISFVKNGGDVGDDDDGGGDLKPVGRSV